MYAYKLQTQNVYFEIYNYENTQKNVITAIQVITAIRSIANANKTIEQIVIIILIIRVICQSATGLFCQICKSSQYKTTNNTKLMQNSCPHAQAIDRKCPDYTAAESKFPETSV